jgi:hypothetical protein
MTLLGFCGLFGTVSYFNPKTGPDWGLYVVWGLAFLAIAGAVGFVASLIWWLVAAIISCIRSYQRRHAEKN